MDSSLLSGISNIAENARKMFETGYNAYSNERDFNYNVAQDRFSRNLALYNVYQADMAYNDNKAWREMTYKQALEREDNAIQRRVEDLKKAGLSPVLAAGSPASSSATGSVGSVGRSSTSATMPHMSSRSLVASGALHDLGKELQEIEYTSQQIKNMKKQNELLNAQIDETKSRTKNQDIRNDVDEYNFDLDKKSFARSDSSGGLAGFIYRVLNNWILSNAVEPVGNAIDSGIDKGKKVIDKYYEVANPISEKVVNGVKGFKEHFPKITIEDGYLTIEEPKKKWFRNKK